MKKFILTLATILWMGVIFSFSAKPAEESGEMSRSVGRMAGKIFVSDFANWSESRRTEFAEGIDYPLRKCAHVTEYAIFGALLMLTMMSYGNALRDCLIWSFSIAVFYAAVDEFHQLFVAGRGGRLTDVLIDSLGVVIGILVVRGIEMLYKVVYNRKRLKQADAI